MSLEFFPQAPGKEAIPGDMSSVSLCPGNAWLLEKLLWLVIGTAYSSLQPATTCSEVRTAAGNTYFFWTMLQSDVHMLPFSKLLQLQAEKGGPCLQATASSCTSLTSLWMGLVKACRVGFTWVCEQDSAGLVHKSWHQTKPFRCTFLSPLLPFRVFYASHSQVSPSP